MGSEMNSLEEAVLFVIGYLVPMVEACGALVVVLGVGGAIARHIRPLLRHDPLGAAGLRLQLGCSMVLGLEFQVAADILRTALSPTWNDIALLAALIALRTVLNFLLERELRILGPISESSAGERTEAGAAAT